MHQEGTTTKLTLRIQQNYQALKNLQKEQMEKSCSNQSLAQLRLRMYQKCKVSLANNEARFSLQSNPTNLQSIAQPLSSKRIQKWQAFGPIPFNSYSQQNDKLQKQFASKMLEYRKNIREEERTILQDKGPSEEQQRKKIQQSQKGNKMFSAVYSNQTGPTTFLNNVSTNQFIGNNNKTNFNQQIKSNNSIFGKKIPQNQTISGPVLNNFLPKLAEMNKGNKFTEKSEIISNVQTKKPDIISSVNTSQPKGFVLPSNQSQSKLSFPSIFTRKFDVPQPSYVQPVVVKGSLFSQSNPLATVSAGSNNLFFNFQNTKKNQQAHRQKAQIEPSKPANLLQSKTKEEQPKINIFANKNINTKQEQKKTPIFNLFNQNSQKPTLQNIQSKNQHKKLENQQIHQKVKQQNKQAPPLFSNQIPTSNSLFGQNMTPVSNLFGNSTVTVNKNQSNPQMFKNFSIPVPPPLITPISAGTSIFVNESPKKEQYKSGSLFTNSFNKSPISQVKNQEQNKSKPGLFKFDLIKAPQQVKSKGKEQITKNIFLDPPSKLFGNKATPSPLEQPKQSTINTPVQNKHNFFANLTHEPQKPSFFNLKPVQPPKIEQTQSKNDDSQKSITKKKPNQIFGDFIKSKPGDMFSKETNKQTKQPNATSNTPGLFGSKSGNFFTAPTPASGSIFSNINTTNMFANLPAGESIFGKAKNQIQKQKQKQKQDQSQNQIQGQQDEPLQAEQQIDPAKSTGNYKYQQSKIIYRETISKFKKGNNNIVQNVIISIQEYSDKKIFLCVRLQNKCDYFIGTIIPGVTQISKINENDAKNLVVRKILCFEDKQPKPETLKIQFKQPSQGSLFMDKFKDVAKKIQNK